jgi:hypothetical protein
MFQIIIFLYFLFNFLIIQNIKYYLMSLFDQFLYFMVKFQTQTPNILNIKYKDFILC